MFKLLTTIPAYTAYKRSLFREKQVGYKIELNDLTNGWVNGAMVADMTRTWQTYGLDAIGNNYFTIGHIDSGISSRFDHESPYYQAWLGGYMVRFPTTREWDLREHYKLALADQKSWLQTYNDPSPYAEVDFSTEKHIGEIEISGFKGNLYQGCIWSNTDVGARNAGYWHRQLMNGFAYIYNKCSLATQLQAENLTPIWTPASKIESFQKILLEGYVAILNVSPIHKAVLYGNGCHFTDKSGKKYNTYKSIGDEILDLMQRVSIVSV